MIILIMIIIIMIIRMIMLIMIIIIMIIIITIITTRSPWTSSSTAVPMISTINQTTSRSTDI